jgi:hypothetical protein
MVRTQVQLTDEQALELKRLSAARDRSIAALVRDSVDRLLRSGEEATRGDLMRRAAGVFGRFRSGTPDLANRHDEHFVAAAEHVDDRLR